ncbi:transglycosylase family protein [Streptomyces sp. I05A-00742]|uniref:transglycosylase family protein n=1 Tax=Streptomyces sp. I05A-00742 TaxID=2732853 RepID=UPI0024B5F058|nr:transglycosylase family protein [Streptomyces sp. I05A-00742]
MPLLGATTADAADVHTWDRVAQCESGGLWSADTGNGFFGGLQMTHEMWEKHGGTEFAPRPDQASRAQQITVAERILEARGPYAWPACAVKSDLTKTGPAPEVNPGRAMEDTPEPARTPSSGKPAPERSEEAPGKASEKEKDQGKGEEKKETPEKPSGGTPDPSSDPSSGKTSDKSADKTSETPEPSGGKHRKPDSGTPAPSGTPSPTSPSTPPSTPEPSGTPTGTPGTSDTTGAPGADDKREGADEGSAATGKHRAEPSGSDQERASRGAERGRAERPAAHDYTVRPGDNLSEIAQEHRVEGGWHKVYQDNKKAVGADPDLIHPGQQLELKK